MKIEIKNSYQYPKTVPNKPAFKGYFACPIKELHIQTREGANMLPMIKELNGRCGKYFKVLVQLKDRIAKPEVLKSDGGGGGGILDALLSKWGQDNKLFLENNKLLVLNNHEAKDSAADLAKLLDLSGKTSKQNIIGGNCFLGKKPTGESFALIGKDAIINSTKAKIVEDLCIKPENLYIVNQPEFHIDMAIRPLTYPYVLVGDCHLAKDFVHTDAKKNLLDEINTPLLNYKNKHKYSSADEMISQLKEHGFKPIRVPGLVGKDKVNFMNAIVHQNPDGSLVYITNKTHFGKEIGINFEKLFKKYLQTAVPEIKEVVFIDGKRCTHDNITKFFGGIHCMSSENPDFEKWNEFIKNRSYTTT